MGYITIFDLRLIGDKDKVQAFEQDLLEESKDGNDEVDSDVVELIECGYTSAKLYDLEEWIDEVAPRHPDVLVILNGDGEESDDLWECRWKGDKCERQDAIIPPFTTPELLTEEEKQNNNN